MAIATVVTRGFSNGSVVGSIALVVVRGYLGAGVGAADTTTSGSWYPVYEASRR